jgi:hypothetical protein
MKAALRVDRSREVGRMAEAGVPQRNDPFDWSRAVPDRSGDRSCDTISRDRWGKRKGTSVKSTYWRSALAGVLAVWSAPTIAQEQDEKRGPEGDIIVTAQKRQGTLQDSDTAITVLDAKAINEARLRDFSQLDDLVPNVQFNQGGQLGNVFITIRGVESNRSSSIALLSISTPSGVGMRHNAHASVGL